MNSSLTTTLGYPKVAVHSWGYHGLSGLRNWASIIGRTAKYRRTGCWTKNALLDYLSQNGCGGELTYYNGFCTTKGVSGDAVFGVRSSVQDLLVANDAADRLINIIKNKKRTAYGTFQCVDPDQYSTCGACYGAVQTEPDCFSWTPDYVVGDGDIYCGCCSRMDSAQGLFDEAEQAGEPLAVNGSGGRFGSAWAMDAAKAKEWLRAHCQNKVETCPDDELFDIGFLTFSEYPARDRRNSVATAMAKEGYSVVTGEDNDSSVDPTAWLFFRKN